MIEGIMSAEQAVGLMGLSLIVGIGVGIIIGLVAKTEGAADEG